MQRKGIVDYRKAVVNLADRRPRGPSDGGKVHPTVALDSAAGTGKDRRSPLSACLGKPIMPKTSSSIERRRLLLALATLALSRHAVALQPGVTASDSAASDTASAPATQAALAPDLRAAVELAPQWRVSDRVELQQAFVRTVSGHGEGLMLHVADAELHAGPQRNAAEDEAAP